MLRLGMGLLLLAAVATQVIDESVHDSFVPGEYFSYFTILSALMTGVVLLLAGVVTLTRSTDSTAFTTVRLAVLSYMVVTGVVYAALLRGVPTDGYAGIAWPNEALHVWAPIFIAFDWLFSPGRVRLAWKSLWLVLIYPVVWLAFTLARGGVTDWYPYPFLDPALPAGWSGVALYIVGIAVFIVAVAAGGLGAERLAQGFRTLK
ncbi:Pr6Pr family membrane protein [Cryobacterium psychrophilum]|uniref:Integral membrane regulator n=1 Tax=Cryobacterium psychrophilum TaxID=41988 RepID=A0A4Y8KPX6_9MICO|nr:Pr6Pr family membrane protein [Cryobacterium psychrophilum]TDW29302.1 hypothetical protein EDD25_0995 [Cryobacterium psychrophilum]TFD79978.1 hypothetical protein E3T53_06135 [Cryobacterium psychrophilum]